jgi:hypothetical protein
MAMWWAWAAEVCQVTPPECSLTAQAWYTLDAAGVSSVYQFIPDGPYIYTRKQNCTATCTGAHIEYTGARWTINRASGLITFYDEVCKTVDTGNRTCFSCPSAGQATSPSRRAIATAAGASSFSYPFKFSANCLVLFMHEGAYCGSDAVLNAYFPVPAATDGISAGGLSGGTIAAIALGSVVLLLVGGMVVWTLRARNATILGDYVPVATRDVRGYGERETDERDSDGDADQDDDDDEKSAGGSAPSQHPGLRP